MVISKTLLGTMYIWAHNRSVKSSSQQFCLNISLKRIKILRPKVTKILKIILKKFCEFPPWSHTGYETFAYIWTGSDLEPDATALREAPRLRSLQIEGVLRCRPYCRRWTDSGTSVSSFFIASSLYYSNQEQISPMFYAKLLQTRIPKVQKRRRLDYIFCTLGIFARKTLMKLTPAVNFINDKRTNFSYERRFL